METYLDNSAVARISDGENAHRDRTTKIRMARANVKAVADVTPARESDIELVNRTCAGDVGAFSELVRRHERMVFNLAYRFMRDTTQAEDMAQDAFLKAFRLLKGFRGDCSFPTWLHRVTSSVCLTEIEKRKRRSEVDLSTYYDNVSETEPVSASDVSELIRRCVPKLRKKYATIITMYYLQETPYEEIARAMRIPIGTLKTWMYRARAELRNLVELELHI